ncbi:unnamed protein product [Allacma fusca]|uniref:Uncharacterized protein n=1 Tax=Allacma fusca TaxID=39272 RepID=A0A8J2Q2F7_9HEXA|nr:unnamed protein product [Allacma fusca]
MGEEGDPPEAKNLKGLSKHFNSVTRRGRANVALFTYTSVAAIGLYFYFKPKSPKATKVDDPKKLAPGTDSSCGCGN